MTEIFFRRLRMMVRGGLLLGAVGGLSAAPAARPNILFILSDDQGAWAFGESGNPQTHTPNLDRLAREGVRLTNYFTPTPVCSPARACLMASRYSSETGILDFIPQPEHKAYTPENGDVGLTSRFVTFAEVLAAAGYTNGLVGKWHLGDWTRPGDQRFHPTKHGFQYFMGLTGGGTTPQNPELEKDGVVRTVAGLTEEILAGEAIGFLERNRDRPFLLCLHTRAPHGPWTPVAEEDAARYRDLDPVIPNPEYPDLDTPRVKKMMREYLACVSDLDRNIGRVLDALERLGLARNTVVIFTSDNGMNMGHNGIWHKGNGIWVTRRTPPARPNIASRYRPNLYDQALRVPAIVRWPGVIRPGAVVSQTVTGLDWYPTIVALAGAKLPDAAVIRGRSIVALLKGEQVGGWDNDFYGEYSMRVYCRTDMRCYRTPQWKLIRDFLNEGRDELYDLQADPAEARNRINEVNDPAVRTAISALDQKMRDRMRQCGDPLLDRLTKAGR